MQFNQQAGMLHFLSRRKEEMIVLRMTLLPDDILGNGFLLFVF
jgi:hypothetical protein